MLALATLLIHLTTGSDFDWRPHNTALEAGALATLALDWSQTIDHQRAGTWEESNPILGIHPSETRISVYFASAALLHVGAARLVPFPFREIFQAGTILLEGAIVRSNRRLGIGFALPW